MVAQNVAMPLKYREKNYLELLREDGWSLWINKDKFDGNTPFIRHNNFNYFLLPNTVSKNSFEILSMNMLQKTVSKIYNE